MLGRSRTLGRRWADGGAAWICTVAAAIFAARSAVLAASRTCRRKSSETSWAARKQARERASVLKTVMNSATIRPLLLFLPGLLATRLQLLLRVLQALG